MTTSLGKLGLILGSVLVMGALLNAALIKLLWPWFNAYALARPNARSLHSQPTPQGGGIPVVAATLTVAWLAAALLPALAQDQWREFGALTAAMLVLAVVGAIDDARNLNPLPRLAVQLAAVALVIAALPADARIAAWSPWWLERLGLVIGGTWFVNLMNFMDGMDWMTAAEVLPITGAIALLGVLGFVGPLSIVLALALFGAMLGFVPFNKPVAKLFLGDVGSLPIGLLVGWLLLQLALAGYVAAAVMLPLYYLADATLTLVRRFLAGERVWQAHRTHFYQIAIARGLALGGIIGRVFLLNLVLVAFALIAAAESRPAVGFILLVLAAALVGWLLVTFARGREVGA
jgi:UDP-N-acetylmuramyl pentapeptide phosphotransferase/UDP-N-acetylglucosamine-1-phosphate transferase